MMQGCRKTCKYCESNAGGKSDDEKSKNPIKIEGRKVSGVSSGCRNTEPGSYCNKYKTYCNSDNAFFMGLMMRHCKKACNFCQNNDDDDMDDDMDDEDYDDMDDMDGDDDKPEIEDETSEDCENVESNSHCDKYITMCESDNAFFMGLMVKYCKKTCDYC